MLNFFLVSDKIVGVMTSLRQDTTIHSLSRAYLESFTSQELLSVAAQLSVDLPESLSNRTLIIGEILEAIEERLKPAESGPGTNKESEDKLKTAKPMQNHKGNPFETVKIPDHYNITYIKALVRDPLWVFVFWEVKMSIMEKLVKMDDFDGLCLRINALKKKKVFLSHTVPVGNSDKAWYLDFPTEGDEFFVEICARVGGRDEVLAKTRSFYQPGILAAHGGEENPLALLSGIRDIPVLREKNDPTGKKRSDAQ
jgi:hypothetical protein